MKRTLFCLSVLLLVLTSGAIGRAQIPPPPTPTPDPQTYSDPGMNFTAPADAHLLARASNATPDVLGEDLATIAAWVIDPGKEDARSITISMEAYDGPPDQWEAQFESQTHSSQDGTLIRDKTAMTLLNGMPAYFVQIAFGSGFDAKKEYAVVWADGERGVVLAETSRLGDASLEEAERNLKQVSAVRYPMNQP
jgi:hypothetical protein